MSRSVKSRNSIRFDIPVPPVAYGREHVDAQLPTGWRRGVVVEGRSFTSYGAVNPHVVFVRTDGAEVNMIHETWRPDWRSHRVWAAFAPGEDYPLTFDRWHSRARSPRLYMTPTAAIQMLNREFPMTRRRSR
jgi:hypothetical protein